MIDKTSKIFFNRFVTILSQTSIGQRRRTFFGANVRPALVTRIVVRLSARENAQRASCIVFLP